MQLILETENTNISISEKMSTFDQNTGDKLVSNGEVKELLEEVNRKSEKNIIDNEIENKENVTANTEDHKESGDTTVIQPSNEDISSAKTEELNGEQFEHELITETMVNAEEPGNEQSEIKNIKTPSKERKREEINLSTTVESKVDVDESKSDLDTFKNDDSQKDLTSEQSPVENNGTSDLQCSENLKEPPIDVYENKSALDTQLKNDNHQKDLASEESPIENNGTSLLQISEIVKKSQMDIDENKEVIEENKSNKQKNEVVAKTLNDIVEPMEVDCDIGRNLEEEVTESINAMVNEVVGNLNHDDTSDFLDSETANNENLEIETTCEKVGSKANLDITETDNTCKYEVVSKANIDITKTETTCEADSETMVDDKQITNSIDKIKEGVLLDKIERNPSQCKVIDTVSTASVEEKPRSLSTLNENSVKNAPKVNEPLFESKAVNIELEKTYNPERKNSTAEVTGDKNALDGSIVKKATEREDNAKRATPMEATLSEKQSTSNDENAQSDSTAEKGNNTTKDMNKKVSKPSECTKEDMETDVSIPLECRDEKNAQKKVTEENTINITSSGSETKVEKIASTNEQGSFQNIVHEDITKKQDQFSGSDDIEDVKLVEDNVIEIHSQKQSVNTPEIVTEATQPSSIIKLSNTMDILSDDDEDEGSEKVSTEDLSPQTREKESRDKQCINLDDDDDVMLIDEEVSKDNKKDIPSLKAQEEEVAEPKCEYKTVDLDTPKEEESKEPEAKDIQTALPKSPSESEDAPKLESEKVTSEVSEKPAQLVPDDFFKTYRKNLADMTRDDLEEFCILKIVESIIDRSNINEIRSKLKSMSQTVEEYKKKATMLTKQNRDLQVVLKSVQEEQKKMTNQSITPLKIMRSVGMQVLMTDKNRRRPPGPATLNSPTASNINLVNNNVKNTNMTNNRQQRNINQSPRGTPLKQANNQPIPVPRLVPAAQNMANRNLAGPPPAGKTNNVQNGIKMTSPSQKVPEKRTHAKVQSETVDLTDDEPPSKQPAKNPPAPPVRLVNTQNLLAQRPQLPQTVNSPRKVFIPINLTGPPAQNVRPGQTVFLKSPSPQGPRPRAQATLPAIRPKQQNSISVKRVQGARHPAPLPDAMKQYQPPNWKALPPAPDLKLSKVENGIVISWKIEGYQEDSYEEIASYQLYAYQETSAPPSTSLWKKIGDVKALPLPMACTLTQFMAGYKYYFAVRAVDVRSRLGPFSLPGSILLLNKM